MVENVADRRTEAALVLTVPEAEPLVESFRSEYAPVASRGMPAHITINYPFIPGVEPTAGILRRLSTTFAAIQPFSFKLDHIGRFPNVGYLAPVPPDPFVQLVERVAREFLSPHLMEESTGAAHPLSQLRNQGIATSSSLSRENSRGQHQVTFPLSAFADLLWLMDDSAGRWEKRVSFRLGVSEVRPGCVR